MPFITISGFSSDFCQKYIFTEYLPQDIEELSVKYGIKPIIEMSTSSKRLYKSNAERSATIHYKYDKMLSRPNKLMQEYFSEIGELVNTRVKKQRTIDVDITIRVVGPLCNKYTEPYWSSAKQLNDPRFYDPNSKQEEIFFSDDNSIRFRLAALLKEFRDTNDPIIKHRLVNCAIDIRKGEWAVPDFTNIPIPNVHPEQDWANEVGGA